MQLMDIKGKEVQDEWTKACLSVKAGELLPAISLLAPHALVALKRSDHCAASNATGSYPDKPTPAFKRS